jgi:outer membrane lipoprotein-sorting protein
MPRIPPATERRTARARALAALAGAIATVVSGCAAVRQPPPPGAVAPESGARIKQLAEALAHRDLELVSMQTGAVMEYSAGDRHVKAREQIAVRRPDSLRVEAMSPFGVALILAARGKQLEIFEPSERKFIRGVASADTLDRYVQIPMAPAEAVGLLMGLAPHASSLAATVPETVASEGPMTVASWRDKAAGTRELGFAEGELAMVRERQPGGLVVYEVRYSDYHDIGGVMFPYVVDADFPVAGSHVTFRYQRPIVNGDVADSMFVLAPPPGTEISAQAQ